MSQAHAGLSGCVSVVTGGESKRDLPKGHGGRQGLSSYMSQDDGRFCPSLLGQCVPAISFSGGST